MWAACAQLSAELHQRHAGDMGDVEVLSAHAQISTAATPAIEHPHCDSEQDRDRDEGSGEEERGGYGHLLRISRNLAGGLYVSDDDAGESPPLYLFRRVSWQI